MNEFDCVKIMERCPYFERCSVPLCPLDPDVGKRVYIEGEPICRLPLKKLMTVLNGTFERTYKRFIRVCLGKGARFKPLVVVRGTNKNRENYEQLKIKPFIDADSEG